MGLFKNKASQSVVPVRKSQVKRLLAAKEQERDAFDYVEAPDEVFRPKVRRAEARTAAVERNSTPAEIKEAARRFR